MTTSLPFAEERLQSFPKPSWHRPPGLTLRQNQLLTALGRDDLGRLADELSLVHLPSGQVVCESGCQQEYAFFPTSAIVSLFYVTLSGATTEMAVIGNEGLAGVCMVLGGESNPHRLVVQSAGHALRIRSAALSEEFHRGGAVQHLLLRYTQALLTQVAQSVVCNRHHCLQQQLCRRLLCSLDRQSSNEICATQEEIANMLGVRREGVTLAAGNLQRAGVIDYHRGSIQVLDRKRLESMACECYRIVKREFSRLAPPTALN